MSSKINKEINLNFKVPDYVAYRLKMIAFEKRMKEKELLLQILEDYSSKFFFIPAKTI